MNTKICKTCKREKPLAKFSPNEKLFPRGRPDCNTCRGKHEYRKKSRPVGRPRQTELASTEYARAWRLERLAKPDGKVYARSVARKMKPISRRHYFRKKFRALLDAGVLPPTLSRPDPADAEAILRWWATKRTPGKKRTIISPESALAADAIQILEEILK